MVANTSIIAKVKPFHIPIFCIPAVYSRCVS